METNLLFICIIIFVSSWVKCDLDTVITPKNLINENPVSRSYIKKFSSSWRSFAEANDITKREKLKKALSDALHSIDFKHKNSDVTVPSVETNAVERIEKAAKLLKDFKQIHALSETVKRTFNAFNEAKKHLMKVDNTDDHDGGGLSMLKRFLVAKTKRNFIAGDTRSNVAKNSTETTNLDNFVLDKPHYIKHTPRISIIATPINNNKDIGVEYISIDPRTSSVDKAKKAFKAAKILLRYAGEKRKSKSEHLDGLIDQMRKDIDNLYTTAEPNEKKKSLFPNKANLFLHGESPRVEGMSHISEGLSHIVKTETNLKQKSLSKVSQSLIDEDKFPKPAEESSQAHSSKNHKNKFWILLDNEISGTVKHKVEKVTSPKNNTADIKVDTNSSSVSENKNKTSVNNKIESELETSEKGKTKKDITKDENSSQKDISNNTKTNDENSSQKDISNNTKKNDKDSSQKDISNNTKTNDENSSQKNISNNIKKNDENSKTIEKKEDITNANTKVQEDISKNIGKEENSTNKDEVTNKVLHEPENHETIRQDETLRRLEAAKEARQKYEVARHELAEKVKELYNMANMYEKEDTASQVLEIKNNVEPKLNIYTPEQSTHGEQTKRDEAHPGVALSGVSHHPIKGILTSDSDDGTHKGFTMGAIDKTEHAVSLEEAAKHHETTVAKKKVYDIGIPSNIKLDELQDEVGKHMKSQEETLKVIAEAIKEDLNDISSTDKKKKMLAAAMSNNQGQKKDGQSNEKIDEYLTKALADIMGNDSVPASEAGKVAESKQDNRENKHELTKSENMKIVEEAMKTHANNPNVPLPLVSEQGDKMVLNKDKSKTNDPINRHDVQQQHNKYIAPLNLKDPSALAMLEKASHMEEQVAAEQDQLYSGQKTGDGPPPAKQNVAPSPDSQISVSQKPEQVPLTSQHDPYNSIKETKDSPNGGQPMAGSYDDEEDDDDDDDDDDERDHQQRHHSHHRNDDEDDDDDDDYEDDDGDNEENADKRTHVRHHEVARKRSFNSTFPVPPTVDASTVDASTSTTTTERGNGAFDISHLRDELMDVKKSKIPKLKDVIMNEADFPAPLYP